MGDQLNKYTLAVLPEKSALNRLNAARAHLYINGFRYNNNPPKNDVHITVAELRTHPSRLEALRVELKELLRDTPPFTVSYNHITNKVHPANDKYPDGSAWIALYFKEEKLRDLARIIDTYLIKKGESATKEYVDSLGISEQDDLYSQIANHMNLCNYARVSKAQEARRYVDMNAPRSFIIDSLILRDEMGNTEWNIHL